MQQAGKSKYHQKRNDKNKHLFHKILLKVKSIPQESSILRGEYNYRPSVLGLFVYVPEFNGIRRVKHGTLNTLLTEKMRFQIFRIIGQFLEFIDIGFDSAHFSHSLNKYRRLYLWYLRFRPIGSIHSLRPRPMTHSF
jgi:hypothetical protein